jgi:CDP-4-dehydro-6-deoxyglucose reductase, E3
MTFLEQNAYRFSISKIQKRNDSIYLVWLSAKEPLLIDMKAGQYLELVIDQQTYAFSIANFLGAPSCLELHIKNASSTGSSQKVIDFLSTEKEVIVRLPFGTCTITDTMKNPLILLAGGTGFSPIKAMVEYAIAKSMKNDIYLYWGARTVSDFYLIDIFDEWLTQKPNFHLCLAVSELTDESLPPSQLLALKNSLLTLHQKYPQRFTQKTGMIHQMVACDFTDLSGFTIIANGPPIMVNTALEQFKKQGLAEENMYSDIFSLPTKNP